MQPLCFSPPLCWCLCVWLQEWSQLWGSQESSCTSSAISLWLLHLVSPAALRQIGDKTLLSVSFLQYWSSVCFVVISFTKARLLCLQFVTALLLSHTDRGCWKIGFSRTGNHSLCKQQVKLAFVPPTQLADAALGTIAQPCSCHLSLRNVDDSNPQCVPDRCRLVLCCSCVPVRIDSLRSSVNVCLAPRVYEMSYWLLTGALYTARCTHSVGSGWHKCYFKQLWPPTRVFVSLQNRDWHCCSTGLDVCTSWLDFFIILVVLLTFACFFNKLFYQRPFGLI